MFQPEEQFIWVLGTTTGLDESKRNYTNEESTATVTERLERSKNGTWKGMMECEEQQTEEKGKMSVLCDLLGTERKLRRKMFST